MTDRQLLELAAKAAGYELWWGEIHINRPRGVEIEHYCCIAGMSGSWNPLRDDGDALRLAVKLKIDVMHTNIHQPQVHALADLKVQEWESSSGDPYAATRRAIVRAAAAIGENMK